MSKILSVIFISALLFQANAQKAPDNIQAFWGSITDLQVSGDELQNIQTFSLHDTIKGREIKWVSKYRFYFQPAQTGPVKVTHGAGVFLNQVIKQQSINPQPGDKIVISEIFAYVENEGVRQIPTAIVLVVK